MSDSQRSVGLLAATGVGLGAIIGGGFLVLAGVAYASAGPSAVVAFLLNGLVALLTAMSFAEMSSVFPQSGGTYTFAKKVLSVRAAFAVGWVLWFAYIVAAVLYALGFATFAVLALKELFAALGQGPPAWLADRRIALLLAALATIVYAAALIRKSTGGGQWATIGKVVVFSIIIVFGAIAFVRLPLPQANQALTPFFAGGISGLFAAMGFTFIAVQGFDLIAAIAGEVKEPAKNIPRAMFISLAVAMAIYLPLMLFIAAAGVLPGESITTLASQSGDTVFALAVSRFMGQAGYWLVIVAVILSTLSALHANILAASRVALSMAEDRTLPAVLFTRHSVRQTPVMAIYASALTAVAILFMVPNVGAAGAAASLIFLISFALSHLTAYLARSRGGAPATGYQTPLFPLVPLGGGIACAGLAVFQAIVVPDAGGVILIWLGLGGILYLALFKDKAETADASAEALDPHLTKLRGKNPLVLVPIANPAHARGLIGVANALAPTDFARVLLLTIVRMDRHDTAGRAEVGVAEKLDDALQVVREAKLASYADGHAPEALLTTATDPWAEIHRVARAHDCQSLLLGVGDELASQTLESRAEELLNEVDCDVAFLRAPKTWSLEAVKRVLVPVGGRGQEHELRARLIGSICRIAPREITFVTVLPTTAPDSAAAEIERTIRAFADVNARGAATVEIVRAEDPMAALIEKAKDHDLLILGLKHMGWGRKVFGEIVLRILREALCATILVSSRRTELYRPLRGAASVRPRRTDAADKPPESRTPAD